MGKKFRRFWPDVASAVNSCLMRGKPATQKDLGTCAHGARKLQRKAVARRGLRPSSCMSSAQARRLRPVGSGGQCQISPPPGAAGGRFDAVATSPARKTRLNCNNFREPSYLRRQETASAPIATPPAKGTDTSPLRVSPGNQVLRPVSKPPFSRFVGGFAAVTTLLAVFLSATTPAIGLTPSSQEVANAVDRAIDFLNSDAAGSGLVGGEALAGMALLKHGAGRSNPRVVAAVRRIQEAVDAADKPADLRVDVYSAGLATIFLVELDPQVYRSEIDFLLAHLKAIQKPHGGWGYPDKPTGDTSMTQYGVLSCWKAAQAGIPLPPGMAQGVATWLLKTQDPSGGFGYQGVLSNTFDPVPQTGIRHSLSAAGLGSVYICADLAGINNRVEEDKDKDGLPPAMKRVGASTTKERTTVPINIHPGLFQAVFARGNNWMEQNFVVEQPRTEGSWTHYYLYALERYYSFRELAEGRTGTRARWYDEVARYLIDTQAEDGSWNSRSGPVCDTAFSALCLMRSSRKSIEKARDFGAGTLIGGRGLPKDSEIVKIRQGQVVATPKLEAVEKLLAATDDTDDSDFSEMMAVLPPEEARALVSKHARKLKELSGDTSADARFAAVKTLGQSSDLDHVPTLIYALTDPEPAVVIEARNGLRRISRRFSGFGLPDEFSPAEVEQATRRWKEWYLAIRPDAQFED